MKFTVVAHTPEDYRTWLEQQQTPAAAPEPGSDAAAGAEIFIAQCTRCHAVDGLLDANGEEVLGAIDAPNLTHFRDRECFAGCMLPTTDENLRRWLANPPAVKAGSKMPDLGLTPEQIDQLIAFLDTLR
jgi:cytochrome c oxidase subunit 2